VHRARWGKSWITGQDLDAHPDTPPVVVTDTVRNAIRIVALDKRARPHGIKPLNQTLSDARALVPELDCHPADDEADRALLLKIAGWCERYTPLVALGSDPGSERDHGLFMDITGCAHLLGGEEALVADLEARLRAQGFHVRLCLADTPGRRLGHGALWPGADHCRGRACRGGPAFDAQRFAPAAGHGRLARSRRPQDHSAASPACRARRWPPASARG
jgi:hypothetical protein